MKKVELLSPAGDFEALESAIKNGADAIYIGGKNFGARMFAPNFSNEEIESAIKLCHLFGVKLYVTVNTIIYDNEIEDVLEYIRFLHKSGVDALIVQDIGLMYILKNKFPNLEVHSSTQSHNIDNNSLHAMKELGCTRCVMAREMSLDEIKKLDDTLEKEVFIHGALCICYSGNCLFSALNGNRSGNRGECTGSCRLPYNLYKDDKLIIKNKYLLSTKSLSTVTRLDEILDTDIRSLKIEGRMKGREYVGYITKLYREKIDNYYKNKTLNVSDEEIDNIKKLYNRELTTGHLFNDNIMNIKTSNHIGVPLGEVIYFDKKIIKIKLNDVLNQGDGIRFGTGEGLRVNYLYNTSMDLVSSARGVAIIDNKIELKEKTDVRKTLDIKLLLEINKYESKKVPVTITCNAYVDKPLEITISDEIDTFTYTGSTLEKAISSPTTKERIEEQLSKLGNTPFISVPVVNTDNNTFISIKELNEARRELTAKLTIARENRKKEFTEIDFSLTNKSNKTNIKLNILVRNEEQLKEVLKYQDKINNIYVEDYNLYTKYKSKYNVYYRTDRVKEEHVFNNDKLLCTSLSSLYKYKDNNEIISDSYLNVTNSYSVSFLKSLGIKLIGLSYEIYDRDIPTDNTEIIIYGTPTLMIIKSDIIDNYDKNSKYYLENVKGNKFQVIKDTNYTSIYHSEPINKYKELNTYKNLGISNYRIELLNESSKEIDKLIEDFYE